MATDGQLQVGRLCLCCRLDRLYSDCSLLPPSLYELSAGAANGFQSRFSQWTRQLVQPRVPLELANWCSQGLLHGEVVISPAIPRLTVAGLGGTLRLIGISLCHALSASLMPAVVPACFSTAGRRFPKKENNARKSKDFLRSASSNGGFSNGGF